MFAYNGARELIQVDCLRLELCTQVMLTLTFFSPLFRMKKSTRKAPSVVADTVRAVSEPSTGVSGHRSGSARRPRAKEPLIEAPADRIAALPASSTALRHYTDDVSSDDEAPPPSAVGAVPAQWYDGLEHVGYSLAGAPVPRPQRSDGIDRFLASQDDPSFRWRVYDEETREEFVLSKRDVALIQRIRAGTVAHTSTNMYPDALDLYSDEVEPHALNDPYEPKRRFIPSKWELRRVYRIAKAIREGRMARSEPKKPSLNDVYLLWGDDGAAVGYEARRSAPPPIPAPKPPLPGHAASYNPPSEYLPTEEEAAAWAAADPADRPLDFLPRRFSALRHVPLYTAGLRERFERCLDLYLCPRMTRRRPDASAAGPEALLPTLPDPAELRPFPTTFAHSFMGGSGARVRSLSVDPTGVTLASGGDDGAVRLWDVASGRLLRTFQLSPPGTPVHCVAWCPAADVRVVAAVYATTLVFLFAGPCATRASAEATLAALRGAAAVASTATVGAAPPVPARRVVSADGGDVVAADHAGDGTDGDGDGDDDGNATAAAKPKPARTECLWQVEGMPTDAASLLARPIGGSAAATVPARICVTVTHPGHLRSVVWHGKGDYVATVAPQAAAGGTPPVFVHQLSRHATTCPFPNKAPGAVQAVRFHPTKPRLFVANQRTVRVFALGGAAGPTLVSKLESGVKWISSIAVHPGGGDHVLLGSYDARVVWLDADLSTKPFRTLKYHTRAVRSVAFHRGPWPLMATASDDGSVHVFHARVFNDFVQNPLIVPVKILRAHTVTAEGLGCLDAVFHPTQPWLFTAGADGAIKLWRDLP